MYRIVLRTSVLLSLSLGAGLDAQTGISHPGRSTRMRPAPDAASGEEKARARARAKAPAIQRFDLEFQHRLTNRTGGCIKDLRIHVPVPEDCYQQKVANLVWLRDGQTARIRVERDQYGQKVASFRC